MLSQTCMTASVSMCSWGARLLVTTLTVLPAQIIRAESPSEREKPSASTQSRWISVSSRRCSLAMAST